MSSLMTLVLVALSGGAGVAWAAQPIESAVNPAATPVPVRLEPASFSFGTCQTTMNVRIYDVANLAGVQYRITFDPTKLQVVDADPSKPGVQIGTGALLQHKLQYEDNQVNNATGVINYVALVSQSTGSVSGTGSLGQITFRVVKPAASNIQFVTTQCLLSKPAGVGDMTIPATWYNATVTATGSCPKVLLPLVAKRLVGGL
jgi:hypothetical protein